MSEDNVERNKRNFRRFQQEVVVGGDMSVVPELIAPQMRLLRSGDDSFVRLGGGEVPQERVITPDQFIRRYGEVIGKPKIHRRTIEAIHGEGDVIWARWKIEEEHDSDRYGVSPTGKLLTIDEAAMVRFDSQGRMIEGWFMQDPIEVLNQIGAKVTVEPGSEQ
ncbi:ester cyclase [Streptomyces sp. NPDC096311]|uniref:ester cyclase n=1 Tax=Streptomyces sp. NPDC096311 TaxID=3366083 RepID=UPI0038275E8B